MDHSASTAHIPRFIFLRFSARLYTHAHTPFTYIHIHKRTYAIVSGILLYSLFRFPLIADACGGVFNASNGTITSPSFPETYPGNKHCVWKIVAPPQYRITLNFTHFDLEGNNVYEQPCEYDWVEVASKLAEDVLKKHGIYCGNKPPPLITSEGNSLKVVFSSDNRSVRLALYIRYFDSLEESSEWNMSKGAQVARVLWLNVCMYV